MKEKNYFKYLLPFITLFIISSCGNSGEYVKLSFSYSQGAKTDYTNTTYYSDDYFSKDSTIYNPSLATTSLSLAMASFGSNINKNSKDYTYRYKNADALLTSFGYKDITPNEGYLKKPEADTIGVVYAKKEIKDDTMIAIGIRGSNYQQEWASNFTLGTYENSEYHKGFYEAATNLLSGLKDYIANENIKGNIKIWVSGYSRAGATANMTGGLLDKALINNENILGSTVDYTKEDIYAYCFEAPQGAYYDDTLDDIEVHGENYNNIFNIINTNDPVPYVAMSELGFTRFGIDKYLTDTLSDATYEEDINKVKKVYAKFDNYSALGSDYLIDKFKYKNLTFGDGKLISLAEDTNHINWPQGLLLKELLNNLSIKGVLNRSNYVTNFEEGLRDIFIVLYKNGLPNGSFVEILINLVKSITTGDELDILFDDLLHNQDYFIKDVMPIIKRALEKTGIDVSIKELITDLKNLLVAIVKVFLTKPSLIISLMSVSNIKGIGSAHYPELCLAHLEARDPNYGDNYITSDMSGRYYYFSSENTDKDFTIKKNDEVIISYKDGSFDSISNSYVYGINNYNFVAYLPISEGYKIIMDKDSTATLSTYEPSKLKYVDSNGTISSSTENKKLNENITVEFN